MKEEGGRERREESRKVGEEEAGEEAQRAC